MQVIAWTIFAIVAMVMIINAVFMLVSPCAWFRLPGWLRVRGTVTEERYKSGGGEVQLRLGGFVILASFVWVFVEFLR